LTQSQEKNSYRPSAVAGDGAPAKPRLGHSQLIIDDESRWSTPAIGLAVIVIAAAVIFEIYRVRRHDLLGSEAMSVGETFIYSSPVVEEKLGSVQMVRKTMEERRLNPAPGWYIDFEVSGRRRSGVVEMQLRNENGQWQVPSAELKFGPNGPVNLR
jgi:hypothetical protein